jgi:xanthine dehydrogenase accessory factor
VVILGRSPIAQTLARLSRTIGYAVTVIGDDLPAESFADAKLINDRDFSLSRISITPRTYVVVSTQGEDDEGALEQAARCGSSYVAFVASKKKAEKILEYLRGQGIAQDRLKQIRVPAGLDIGAGTPEEIAVSILAELIQVRARQAKSAADPNSAADGASPAAANPKTPTAATQLPVINHLVPNHLTPNSPTPNNSTSGSEARDPICGMMVNTATAKYKTEYQGKWFYFCCGGCLQKFSAKPQEFSVSQ